MKNFPEGWVVRTHLGFDPPMAIGDHGYLWAEGSDWVHLVRYGLLEHDSDWVFLEIGQLEHTPHWKVIPGCPYVYRTNPDDALGIIEFKEADSAA